MPGAAKVTCEPGTEGPILSGYPLLVYHTGAVRFENNGVDVGAIAGPAADALTAAAREIATAHGTSVAHILQAIAYQLSE